MIDTRQEEDILTSELTTFLGRRHSFKYVYQNKNHDLRLKGPLRYMRITPEYMNTKLWNLQYKEEELTDDEIKLAIADFSSQLILPYAVEEGIYNYNFLLAFHCHNNQARDELGQLILKDPTLLNYNTSDRPFGRPFSMCREFPRITAYGQNLFDNSAQYELVFTKNNTVAELQTIMRENAFHATHVTWHLYKHAFVFYDLGALTRKIIQSSLEDCRLYQDQLSLTHKRGGRPTERMITYSDSEHLRRIIAVAPLLLNHAFDHKITAESAFLWYKRYADIIHSGEFDLAYPLVTTKIKQAYYLMYNSQDVIFLPTRQRTFYFGDVWPYYHALPDLNRVKAISSRSLEYVTWRSPVDSNLLYKFSSEYVEVSSVDVSTTTIPLRHSCGMYSTPESLYHHTQYGPTLTALPASYAVEDLTSAVHRYVTSDSDAQSYLNNSRYDFEGFQICMDRIVHDVLNNGVKIARGSLRHLALSIYLTHGLVIGFNVDVRPQYKIRSALNGSVIKMIACYVQAVNMLYGAETTDYIKPGLRVLFLGSENEPAMDVLKSFYGPNPISVRGIGDRGIGPNKLRMDINDFLGVNFKSDIIISDIDQADYQNPSQEKFTNIIEFCKRLSLIMAANGKLSIMKLSMPSRFLINHLCSTLINSPTINSKVTLMKLSAQKPYSYEAYFVMRQVAKKEKLYFNHIPISYLYEEIFDLPVTELSIRHTISNELYFDTPAFYRLLVSRDNHAEVYQLAHLMSSVCSEFTTRSLSSHDGRVSRDLCISGFRDNARIALMLRMVDSSGITMQAYDDVLPRCKTVPMITLLPKAFPNGFGALAIGSVDYTRRLLSVPHVLRFTAYHIVSRALVASWANTMKYITIIGGRDLQEIVAVRNFPHVPITVYDPSGYTHEYPSFRINYIAEAFDFDKKHKEGTITLCLFVIMTQPDGTPRSADTQMKMVQKLYDAHITDCVTYVLLFTDKYARTVDQMTKNESLTCYTSEGKTYASISGYEYVECISQTVIDTFVSSHSGVRILPFHYRDMLQISMIHSGVFGDSGAFLKDLGLGLITVLEIRF